MFVYTLVFVIKAIIVASLGIETEKIAHLVFIKREGAGIRIGVFVILIKFASIAACLVLMTVF